MSDNVNIETECYKIRVMEENNRQLKRQNEIALQGHTSPSKKTFTVSDAIALVGSISALGAMSYPIFKAIFKI